MALASINEEVVTSALLGIPAIVLISLVGLVARRDENYFAVVPDRIAAIDLDLLPDPTSWTADKTIHVDGKTLPLAVLEIRTRVSAWSLNEAVYGGAGTVYVRQLGSAEIRNLVPFDHLLQVFHQCDVLGVVRQWELLNQCVLTCISTVIHMCHNCD